MYIVVTGDIVLVMYMFNDVIALQVFEPCVKTVTLSLILCFTLSRSGISLIGLVCFWI